MKYIIPIKKKLEYKIGKIEVLYNIIRFYNHFTFLSKIEIEKVFN